MEKQRNAAIDDIRGLAMMAMIAIHATSYFLSDPVARAVWNALQFAVVAFIFCSSYLTFRGAPIDSLGQVASYFQKRIGRLLIPYYIFLAVQIPLWASHEPGKLTLGSLVRTATLTTWGNDLSWLVLLFLMLAIVAPLLSLFYNRFRALFYTHSGAALACAVLLLFVNSPLHYKLVMWLPWSLVVVSAWPAARTGRFPRTLAISAALLFAISAFVLWTRGASLTQYDNKYPPNLYHLSYGLLVTGALWWASQAGAFRQKQIGALISYLSRYSYSIYFIHFLILYIFVSFLPGVTREIGWLGLLGVLLAGACTIQYFWIRFRSNALTR